MSFVRFFWNFFLRLNSSYDIFSVKKLFIVGEVTQNEHWRWAGSGSYSSCAPRRWSGRELASATCSPRLECRRCRHSSSQSALPDTNRRTFEDSGVLGVYILETPQVIQDWHRLVTTLLYWKTWRAQPWLDIPLSHIILTLSKLVIVLSCLG